MPERHWFVIVPGVVVGIIVLAVAVVPLVEFAKVIWFWNAPAVPASSLRELRVGMTRGDVLHLLGEPRWRYEGDGHPETWCYARGSIYTLEIDFTPEGVVEYYEHDD